MTPSRMWVCSVVTEQIMPDGYYVRTISPTFYLVGDVQGITSDTGADRVARRMFEDAGATVLSVAVSETSMNAHSYLAPSA